MTTDTQDSRRLLGHSRAMSNWKVITVSTAFAALQIGCVEEAAAPRLPDPVSPTVEVVAEQEILTPLPLRVRLPSHAGAEKVLVFFHTWGSKDWGMLELARTGQTWAGAVSCREVSTVTGDTKYFFIALNGAGEQIGGSGRPGWPHVATIVHDLPGGARGLNGGPRMLRCHDPADCPPDFPGCPAYQVKRPACQSDNDCNGAARCAWDHYCSTPEPPPDAYVNEDEQLARAR
jgi:hypothetical protein